MHITIVGCGKVGFKIAKNLSFEKGVRLTIIDLDSGVLERASESVDAMFIRGSGLNDDTLDAAGVRGADLVICVTGMDETNILCCILAKRLGAGRTAARVRNPEFALDLNRLWRDLGLDMTINPEYETAKEISRLLRFPSADGIETFVGGRVELASFKLGDDDGFFLGKSVGQVFYKKKTNTLLAMVERGNGAVIPHGGFVFEKNDVLSLLGRPSDIIDFLMLAGKITEKIKEVVIIGGSRITYYLIELLQKQAKGISIKVIELDRERCEELSERYPRCVVINGDGTDENIVTSEISGCPGAVVCLTDRDEDNMIVALYSLQSGTRKVILKINYINKSMVKDLGIGSMVSPQAITSDHMIRYIRGMGGAGEGEIKALYKIFESEDAVVEASEFSVKPAFCGLEIPIKEMRLRGGILIGCIVRNSNIIIPSGDTVIRAGDSVIIIAKNDKILELDDILED